MLRSLMSRLVYRSHNKRRADDHLLASDGYHVERLEDRRMLAGQVSVSVTGDNVRIIGDSADNLIAVTVVLGRVRVQGFDTAIVGDVDPDTGLTSVAGEDLNNLTIRLKGGNDQVLGGPVPAPPDPGSLGAPQQAFGGPTIEVGGNLKIVTGAGDDSVFFVLTEVTGDATMNLGAGDDTLIVVAVEVDGNLSVRAGGGDDLAIANASTANGNVLFQGGAGEDTLRLGLNGGVTLGGNRVLVNMGGGNDTLLVGDTSGNPDANIRLNGGGGNMDARNDFPPGIATIVSFEIVIV